MELQKKPDILATRQMRRVSHPAMQDSEHNLLVGQPLNICPSDIFLRIQRAAVEQLADDSLGRTELRE